MKAILIFGGVMIALTIGAAVRAFHQLMVIP